MTYVIAAALLCFILPAFVLGGFVFISGLRYKKTIGTVVGEDVVNSDTDQLSAPIVEFETPDGRKITFTEKVHSNETILDIIGTTGGGSRAQEGPQQGHGAVRSE